MGLSKATQRGESFSLLTEFQFSRDILHSFTVFCKLNTRYFLQLSLMKKLVTSFISQMVSHDVQISHHQKKKGEKSRLLDHCHSFPRQISNVNHLNYVHSALALSNINYCWIKRSIPLEFYGLRRTKDWMACFYMMIVS